MPTMRLPHRASVRLRRPFLLAGLIGALMPVLAGLIGILTTARYGLDAGLGGYRNLTTLAFEISPVVGGVAIAAVLAAVISSGGPILLSSATMLVRDWLPFTRDYSSAQKLRAYRITTTIYAFAAAVAAWLVATQTNLSILDLLLFGFAMVVPPAVSVGNLIYRRGTTEQGAYWGMVTGYAGGLVWFALIKLALLSQNNDYPEDYMVQLDLNNTEPGYRCGRLLAVLERAQGAAIRNLNTTIVDRFYGTASTAPGSVFSHLMKGAQAHLSTLKRDNRGAHNAIQAQLEEVMSGLDTFPKTLTPEQQGLFALGYYHQKAQDRAQTRERSQARKEPEPKAETE